MSKLIWKSPPLGSSNQLVMSIPPGEFWVSSAVFAGSASLSRWLGAGICYFAPNICSSLPLPGSGAICGAGALSAEVTNSPKKKGPGRWSWGVCP
jgi:hypothetical protein